MFRQAKCTALVGALSVMQAASAQEAPPAAAPQPGQQGQASENADELIREVEKVMYPDSRTTMSLRFSSKEGRAERYEMVCHTRDRNQKIIVRIMAPANQAGNDLLMIDQNVWAYDKRANRVMRVGSNQAFGGTGFSYGDVVRLNFSDSYSAVIKGENSDAWLLELTAKDRNAPYYRIELSVAKEGKWPLKGIHYARNGSVVKEVAYSDIRDVGAGRKPVVLTVSSPVDPGAINVMTIEREERRQLPERIFNKRNLETRIEEKL
jgi:outer membrane lipoprotein-sorting protein